MKKIMKKRFLKYSLFSLLLCITLLFTINLKPVKAVETIEITDLTGYIVTLHPGWTASEDYGSWKVGLKGYNVPRLYIGEIWDNMGVLQGKENAFLIADDIEGNYENYYPEDSFVFEFTNVEGDQTLLIQWLTDNNATFTNNNISEETETIKAGTYKFNETIIEPTFEGTFDLPTKIEIEISEDEIDEINIGMASDGIFIEVQDYLLSLIFYWNITKETSQVDGNNQEFSILNWNLSSLIVQPYNEVLHSLMSSVFNSIEMYNSSVSSNVEPSVELNFTEFTITEDTEVSVEFYEWFTNNTTFIDYENITGSIFNVFTLISSWISSVVLVVVPIMWTGTELTTLGILAVCGLAVSVILLLIALISRFLKFRG